MHLSVRLTFLIAVENPESKSTKMIVIKIFLSILQVRKQSENKNLLQWFYSSEKLFPKF